MRRFSSASFLGLAAIVFFTAVWSACGGGSSNNSTFVITSFTFSPTTISLEPGQFTTVSATPFNSSGTVVSATVTYTSSDPANAAISPGGVLCAGSWDQTFTVCTPTYQSGKFTITATANGAKGTATAFIHPHADAVIITAPAATCTSAGKILSPGVSAKAYTFHGKDSSGNSCTPSPANNNLGCDITSQVGGFSFGALDSTIASIDSAGNLTAGVPGTTKLFAVVLSGSSSTTSVAVPYTTCLVDSISLHVAGKTDTSVALAKSTTASLQADVLDSIGNKITPTLTFNNLQSVVGTVAAATTVGTATYSASNPGYGSVVASCTPPGCNKNVSAVFSNVVTTTVQNSATDTGVTANDTNIYVSGIGAVQMYPVDSQKFTLGTVMSLPYTPNSIAMSRDGLHIFLGSDTAGMVVSTATNSVQILSFPGKVLAVAPNNAYVIYANTDTSGVGKVNIISGTSLGLANPGGFAIPNVSAAAFTPDGNTVYFAAGSNLYRYRILGDAGSTPVPLTLSNLGSANPLGGNTAKDVKTSANGSIVFTSAPPNIYADESCNANVSNNQYTTVFDQVIAPIGIGTPTMLAALPNGSGMLAVNGSNLENVAITSPNPLTAPFAGCPATGFAVSPNTISLAALGAGITVNQLVISHSGHYAAVFTNTPHVGIIDLTKGTLASVALVNKGNQPLTQSFSGDFVIDDSGVWLGADDSSKDAKTGVIAPLGTIHFIDMTKLADTEQVNVPIQGPNTGTTINFVNPSLVVVQPK